MQSHVTRTEHTIHQNNNKGQRCAASHLKPYTPICAPVDAAVRAALLLPAPSTGASAAAMLLVAASVNRPKLKPQTLK
jgi:hypothetical protein